MNGIASKKAGNINNKLTEAIHKVLVLTALLSVFLFPSFTISESLPKFRFEDFTLPIVLVLLFLSGKLKRDLIVNLVLLFTFYILFTIFLNKRYSQYRDYFEILKMIKFILFYILFSYINWQNKFWMTFFQIVFLCLIVFNLFQYFDILGFNKTVEPFYSGSVHLDSFGLNSLGQQGTKRLLGTMGNPNNNAVLWAFFVCLFFITAFSVWIDYLFFLTAFVGMLSCQSRTIFIGFVIILVFNLIVRTMKLRQKIWLFIMLAATFIIFFYLEKATYIGSLSNTEIVKTQSVKGRMEVWSELFEMIIQKPVFGHAPFKEYFYNNNIYPESEYILIAWRYGMVGVLFFVAWLIIPALRCWRNRQSDFFLNQLSFVIILSITAITNTPLQEPRILIMFALCSAAIFSMKNNTTSHVPVIVSRQ